MSDRWSNYVVAASGCWEWQGYADSNGYARVYDPERPPGKRIQWAHRAFYERFKDVIKPGHEIDHTCCNTICVNPDHLDQVTRLEHCRRTYERLGTYDRHRQAAELRMLGMTYAQIADVLGFACKTSASDAVRSAIEKGLADADAMPFAHPLTQAEREDVRTLRSLGIPQQELAAWYGVDDSHISRICNQKDRRISRRRAQKAEEAA